MIAANDVYDQGRFAEAAAMWQPLLGSTRFPRGFMYRYGVALFRTGRMTAAREAFHETLEDRGTSGWDMSYDRAAIRDRLTVIANAHFYLGQIAADSSRWDDALAEYREAMLGGVMAARILASIILADQKRDLRGAIALLDHAWERLPMTDRERESIARLQSGYWHQVGQQEQAAGRAAEAVTAYRTALRFRPGWDVATASLARLTADTASASRAAATPPPPLAPALPRALLTQWFSAVSRGDTLRMTQMVRAQPALARATDSSGYTALFRARTGRMAEQLILEGADWRVRAPDGRTALHAAAARGDLEVVALLRGLGAPLLQDSSRQSPLHLAMASPAARAIVPVLLGRATTYEQLNWTNAAGRSALMLAAMAGHQDLVMQLIVSGVMVGNRDSTGKTAAALATDHGHAALGARLLTLETLGSPCASCAYIQYVNSNNVSGVERMLAAAPALASGRTLALIAGQSPDTILALLLAAGASTEERDLGGRTPLLTAVAADREELVRRLLAAGADVRASDRRGQTALHLALGFGVRPAIGTMLIAARGAPVEARDSSGYTPLIVALRRCLAEHIRQLVAAGASLESPAPGTVLSMAIGSPRCVEILLDAGANPNGRPTPGHRTPVHRALNGGFGATATVLLQRGADPRLADSLGTTPLHDAIVPETAALLLDRGADVNAMSRRGTPLHGAAERGSITMATFFLDRGADATLRDAGGRTALDLARASTVHVDIRNRMVELLEARTPGAR